MDNRLARLIAGFQESVLTAVVLMHRSGLPLPYSSLAWLQADVPSSGVLEGGVHYCKHSGGCEVDLDTGTIDFDFGENGEVNGLDKWRLAKFAKKRLDDYGFESTKELDDCFDAAVASQALVRSGYDYGLYYIASLPRVLAVDVDCRLPGDMLPHRDQDRVLLLYVHYFLTADLMHENYTKLKRKLEKTGRLSQNEEINYRIYLVSWLGFLAVTCEGFGKLVMRRLLQEQRPAVFTELTRFSDPVGRVMNIHSDSLRKFRNNVFHLRDGPAVMQQFFDRDAERVSWAHELHASMKRFFSGYRAACEAHYAVHHRRGEMHLTPKQLGRFLSADKGSSRDAV